MAPVKWQDVARAKQSQRYASIPAEWRLPTSITDQISSKANISVLDIPENSGILTAKDLEITEKYDATDLLEMLRKKAFTSYEVTLAFCKRAAIAHQLVNCCTEMFFDRALERAKWLDEQLEQGGPVGPLHGLPVSIKDCFKLQGIDAISGYAAFAAEGPAKTNSTLVDFLLQSGAVLYVKTNVPQTMMVAEADNNVFGRTLNPHKLCLGPGGSSGGEGALGGLRGTVLGFGTDIGGSVRIPALCCGLFGMRPTTDRVPYAGQAPFVKAGHPPDISCAAGPLARSARDVHFILKTIVESEPWTYDYTAVEIPWKSVHFERPLRIGYIAQCPSWPVASPVLRTMEFAKHRLEKAGHKVITLSDHPSFLQSSDLAWRYFDLDNDVVPFKKFPGDSGEPLIPAVQKMYVETLHNRKARPLEELFDMNVERDSFRQRWHEICRRENLDVILTPGNKTTAAFHDEYGRTPYTVMWNLVNYSACTIPVGKVDKSVDHADPKLPFYDPELADGMPCSVQVAAKTGEDEKLVAALEIISEALTTDAESSGQNGFA